MIRRTSVGLAVLLFNVAESLTGDVNPFIRAVAYLALLLNVPYYVCARLAWRRRLQAYARMIGDVSLVSLGLWGAGGLAAAAYIRRYSIGPRRVRSTPSARPCL